MRVAVAGFLIALSTAVCASPDGFRFAGPERPGRPLSEAEITALAEALFLEDHRRFDDAAFERLYDHSSVEVRRRAIAAAGRTGDRAATPLLIRALEDPDRAVRADAAFAIGQLGDTSMVVLDALRNSVRLGWTPVRAEETTVVVEVVAALGKLGSEPVRRMVGEALRATMAARDPNGRRVAAEALLAVWKLGDAGARFTAVAPFLDSPDSEIRWRATYAAMRLARPDGAARLVPLVADPDPRVRQYAARGLPAHLADSAAVRDTALAVLETALADREPHVRINALGSLASYGDDAPLDHMSSRLRDRDANVAVAAAAALGRLGPRAQEPLAHVAADAAVPMPVRAAALTHIAAADPERGWDLAEPWVDGDPTTRYLVARALPAMGWDRTREALDRLVRDADRRVAVAALQAAGQMAADTALGPGARAGLRALLTGAARAGDPLRRTVALAGLAPLLEAGDVPALLAIYDELAGEESARPALVGAIEALGSLSRRDPELATEFFRRFPPHPDRWVRRAADRALGAGWGPAPAAVAAEAPAFYEDVVRAYVVPAMTRGHRPRATIRTAAGDIVLELVPEEAPLTVHNFLTLANDGFYDDGVWHRVVPNFVLQDGAPGGYAIGGPGGTIRDEINRLRYERGMLGMALSGPDTGGSQWFITHSPQPHLDGGFTVFGRVIAGMNVADRVVQGEPIHSIRVRR